MIRLLLFSTSPPLLGSIRKQLEQRLGAKIIRFQHFIFSKSLSSKHHHCHYQTSRHDHRHEKIRILTTIAPQFLKYGDCCGFAFLPNNKWNHVSHWLESIIVIISILSASWMYSLHCIHCIQWYLLKLHLSVIIACFVVLRIFDTLELTSNEAIDILKS